MANLNSFLSMNNFNNNRIIFEHTEMYINDRLGRATRGSSQLQIKRPTSASLLLMLNKLKMLKVTFSGIQLHAILCSP